MRERDPSDMIGHVNYYSTLLYSNPAFTDLAVKFSALFAV